jgi:hypothetical protein
MRRLWFSALVAAALGCGTPPPQHAPEPTRSAIAPSATAPVVAPSASAAVDDVARRARAILAKAAETEPSVTPKLVAIAQAKGGAMYKLEFRLKTQASTERKLRAKMAGKGLSLDEVIIDDGLRYTMRVDDEPAGRHLRSIVEVLAAFDGMGHQLVKLKNYWPGGDNYSGINGVLRAPNQLLWELQFHTSDSLKVQADTRDMYEELRRTETPVERRRELFDAMTRAWSTVPVPKGILEAGALHPRAEIIDRPRP